MRGDSMDERWLLRVQTGCIGFGGNPRAAARGAHAILLLDQAGWHGSGALIVPTNITLLPPPSKCPELNPVENIWQFMRENWLSNRIFKSYVDTLDNCGFAGNRFVDQPWRIMSIGLRRWAHGRCSMGLGMSSPILGMPAPCRSAVVYHPQQTSWESGTSGEAKNRARCRLLRRSCFRK